jgi:hypothetical protein
VHGFWSVHPFASSVELTFCSCELSCVITGRHTPALPRLTQVQQARGPASMSSAASAETATNEESILEFVKNDTRRMLHVVYRVGDLDKTIK